MRNSRYTVDKNLLKSYIKRSDEDIKQASDMLKRRLNIVTDLKEINKDSETKKHVKERNDILIMYYNREIKELKKYLYE